MALVFLLAGCGGPSTVSVTKTIPTPTPTPSSQFAYQPALANVPACAFAGRAIPFPANFPRNFPVPVGTDIDSTHPISGGISAVGFIPAPSFYGAIDFFPREVVRAGFKLEGFVVNAPTSSTGKYIGRGYVGTWNVKTWCKGAMALQISARKAP